MKINLTNFKVLIILLLVLIFIGSSYAAERVVIGRVPSYNPIETLKKHKILLEYLEKETGFEFFVKFAKDYNTIIENAIKKEYDIVVFGPVSYVEAAEKCDFKAFVMPSRKGKTYYRSIVVIHNDSKDIQSIKDLNGVNMAFSDIHSSAGFIFPIVELYQNNVKPKVFFTGGQDKAVYSVYQKRFSAAAGYDDIRKSLKQKQILLKKTKILYRTGKIPNEPWAIRESLEKEKKEKIKHAFFNLVVGEENTMEVLKDFNFQGFVETDDKEYDSVRKVLKEFSKIKNKIVYLNLETKQRK